MTSTIEGSIKFTKLQKKESELS